MPTGDFNIREKFGFDLGVCLLRENISILHKQVGVGYCLIVL
jgi:hypothetical protein